MDSDKKRYIGIDIGGTTISFIDMFSPDDLLAEVRLSAPSTIDDVMECLTATVAKLVSSGKSPVAGVAPLAGVVPLAGVAPPPVGVGLAVAGQVDHQSGNIIFSPNLPFKEEYPLGSELEKRTDLPVKVENDANAAAIGEKVFGAAKEMDDFISITLGTGLGSGIFSGGKLLRGVSGSGGEAGHIVIDPNGSKCNCGGRGCLETFCTGLALTRIAARRMGAPKSGKEICDAAEGGDETAIAILREAGERLGDGLVSLVNIFNPEAIFFSGSLASAPEIYFEPAFKKAREKSFGTLGKNLRLETSRFAGNIGVIGAAALSADGSW